MRKSWPRSVSDLVEAQQEACMTRAVSEGRVSRDGFREKRGKGRARISVTS